jgi:hypothetical protein
MELNKTMYNLVKNTLFCQDRESVNSSDNQLILLGVVSHNNLLSTTPYCYSENHLIEV